MSNDYEGTTLKLFCEMTCGINAEVWRKDVGEAFIFSQELYPVTSKKLLKFVVIFFYNRF